MRGRLTALLFTALALAAAPSSHADPGDASFVQQLSAAGINMTDPPTLVGNTGRLVCQLITEYKWPTKMVTDTVKRQYPSLSDSQDHTLVTLAQKTYCPDA
jgi:hypothetical protein